METIKTLLDEVKRRKDITSHYALAKALDLPTQRISDYYNEKGARYPDAFACLQIAKALGRDLREIESIVQIESEKDEKRRQAWKDYYKSIGGIAASFLMAVTAVIETIDFTNQSFWL